MVVNEIKVIHDFVCAVSTLYAVPSVMYTVNYRSGATSPNAPLTVRSLSAKKTVPSGRSDSFSIKYRPYYLNYNPHPHSVDKSELIDVRPRNMTPEQRTALVNRMKQIGRSMSILFKTGRKIGSTRDAHRVVYYCQMSKSKKGADTPTTNDLVGKIFEAYHEREMDISDPVVLRELAADAGMSREEVDGWLDACPAVVDEEARRNKEEVKSGVPVFIVQGEHRIDGSRDIAEFLEYSVR